MARETTLVLVKPDGMQRRLAGEIIARLERRGLELRGVRLLKVSKAMGREHYAEHKGKPFFPGLVDFISSGPVLALAVSGESAVSVVRTMMGATNPLDSRARTIPRRLRPRAVREHRPRLRLESERRESALLLPDGPVWLDYVARNRDIWTKTNAEYTDDHARRAWAEEESPGASSACRRLRSASWGTSAASTSSSSGAARRFSALLAKRGARPVGVDVTPAQLDTARRQDGETGIHFPLVEASAENVPLPDASFDLAVSEHGPACGAIPLAGCRRPLDWRGRTAGSCS